MEEIKPMTKEELANLSDFPQVHKDAIEKALSNWSFEDDPKDKEDKVWPSYFRGDIVQCMLGCQISEDDKLSDDEYETECVWFQSGWLTREKASQGKLV